MATEKKVSELVQLVSKLPVNEQLELIARLSVKLASKKATRTKKRTWMEMAGLGAEIWKHVEAQEYVRQERASWEN
ncbi:MAG TPA: hypothetical protein EYP63_01230 [Desulfotomaculum sp.]|nr:hypothetical protein [Desulfotomaculum sp.]